MPKSVPTKRKPTAATTAQVEEAFYILERDGITFSLLSTFRDCRWKARNYMKGITKMSMGFPIVFGNIVHAALEHAYQGVRDGEWEGVIPRPVLGHLLDTLEETFKKENPRMNAELTQDLELTMLMTQQVLPRYFSFWWERDSELTWLETEQEFKLPWAITLPAVSVNGIWQPRVVKTYLRGKIDGLFERASGVGSFETKTKGRVEPGNLMSMLPYNLQVMIYLLAAEILYGKTPTSVIYNIVRRPQLRQKQSENLAQFAQRIGEDIDDRPDFYFMRINMDLEANDLKRGRANLDDLLRDFVLWWIGEGGHYPNDNHCENKYGTCEFLNWCDGSMRNQYYIRPKMFSELGDV